MIRPFTCDKPKTWPCILTNFINIGQKFNTIMDNVCFSKTLKHALIVIPFLVVASGQFFGKL